MQAEKCPGCGAQPLTLTPDGNCGQCGVDPFVADIVGGQKALADMLAAERHDVHAFVERLADMLEDGFGDKAEVKRRGLFKKRVSEVIVDLQQHVYRLVVGDHRATAHRARHSRGIKLKDETLELHHWLDELGRELATAARASQRAKEALARFVSRQ
jgi:hypothetical protein